MNVVITAFHNYTPMYDHTYYDVISDYFLKNFEQYWQDEVDQLVILDSNWNLDFNHRKVRIIKTNPNLRYYDAYKQSLPNISAVKVLFLDNDMVIYRQGLVKKTFNILDEIDVVSIFDTIGRKTFPILGGKSKFCPYWFASKKTLLMEYLTVDWGPKMPEYETLGMLTKKMIKKGKISTHEWEEDKTSLYYDGSIGYGTEGKDLGYYHIRSGSIPAYLLTHKECGNKQTYWDYLKSQPKQEILRQWAWYRHMAGEVASDKLQKKLLEIAADIGIDVHDLEKYQVKFTEFHGQGG